MPVVNSYVAHLFHREPALNPNSDEMIVRGLGYLCGVKARDQSVKDYVLTDICPFSLGTATRNISDSGNPYFTPIIPRNTVLPCSRVHRFYTADDHQRQVTFPVLQGEHVYARDNRKLAEYTLAVPEWTCRTGSFLMILTSGERSMAAETTGKNRSRRRNRKKILDFMEFSKKWTN